MDTEFYELLSLVEDTESNMDAICLLASNIFVSKPIIINLKLTRQSLMECKNSLLEYANNKDDFVRKLDKPGEAEQNFDNSFDEDKPIKDELGNLHEVKPCFNVNENILASDIIEKLDEQINDSDIKNVLINQEDSSTFLPKEEIVDFDDRDLECINDTNEDVSSEEDFVNKKNKYSGINHNNFIYKLYTFWTVQVFTSDYW